MCWTTGGGCDGCCCCCCCSLIISKLPSRLIKSVLARMTPGRGLSVVPLDDGGDCVLLPGLPIDELSGDWGDRGGRPGERGDGGSDISEHSDKAP